MITSFDVYLISILDSIGNSAVLLAIISAILSAFSGGTYLMMKIEEENPPVAILRGFIASIFIFSLSLIVATLTPSTKQAWVIFGLPLIVNNKQVQQLPDNALEVINSYLKDLATDLQKKESGKNENNSGH